MRWSGSGDSKEARSPEVMRRGSCAASSEAGIERSRAAVRTQRLAPAIRPPRFFPQLVLPHHHLISQVILVDVGDVLDRFPPDTLGGDELDVVEPAVRVEPLFRRLFSQAPDAAGTGGVRREGGELPGPGA